MPLSLPEFVTRWKASTLSERAAAQSHFMDLCDVLGQPHPAAADPTGDTFTFEKHVSKLKGGKGYADVWKRGHFAWEYKGKDKDLHAAYAQLADYREDLENPPLLVSAIETALKSIPTSPTRPRASTLSRWTICLPALPPRNVLCHRWRFCGRYLPTRSSYGLRGPPPAFPNTWRRISPS